MALIAASTVAVLLPLFANGQLDDSIHKAKTWLDHLTLIKREVDSGRCRLLISSYERQLKKEPSNPMLLCGYASLIRSWHQLQLAGLEPVPMPSACIQIARKRLEKAMSLDLRDAFPITTMYWHEITFWVRSDEPSSISQIEVLDNHTGKRKLMPVWHFDSPDPSEAKRLKELRSKAVSRDPTNFEVLYIVGMNEADGYGHLVEAWRRGGKVCFGPTVLHELALSAEKTGRRGEALTWKQTLVAYVDQHKTDLSTRAFLKAHPGIR